MKLTKLPNNCDPSLMIEKQSRQRFSVCPICGESRNSDECLIEREDDYEGFLWGGVEQINYVLPKGWYGAAKGDILGVFLPWRQHHWRIDCYRCHTCGAEWESDPYPTDIKGI